MVDPRTHQPFHGLLRTHSFEIDGSGKKKQSNMMQDTDSNTSLESSFYQRKQRSEKRLVAKEKMLPPALSDKSIVPCDGKTKRRPKAKELKREKWDILVTSQKLFPAITTIFVTVFFAVAIPDWKFQ